MSPKTAVPDGVSVVTTTWNEQENIIELIRRIRQTLAGRPHEIVVVDDNSPDGTLEVAKQLADVAIGKAHEGQTKGLLLAAKHARYPIVVTIDSDLENPPETIPALLEKLADCDIAVASRMFLPRISERWAAATLGRLMGVSDFYSNFRAFRREAIVDAKLRGGETFGGELLIAAKKRGFKVGELRYQAPPRRYRPRIGGTLRANLRITAATWRCLWIYLLGRGR